MQRLTAKVKIGILAPIQEVFEALVNPEIMKNYFISKVSNRMEMKMQPTGKFKDVQTALANLEKNQRNVMGELKNFSMEDLSNRVIESPMGSIDAYQFMLFIPGNTARHTLQIQEVKKHPNFPKAK